MREPPRSRPRGAAPSPSGAWSRARVTLCPAARPSAATQYHPRVPAGTAEPPAPSCAPQHPPSASPRLAGCRGWGQLGATPSRAGLGRQRDGCGQALETPGCSLGTTGPRATKVGRILPQNEPRTAPTRGAGSGGAGVARSQQRARENKSFLQPSAALIYYLDGNRGGKNNIPESLSPRNPCQPRRPRAVGQGQGEVGARGALVPWMRRALRGVAPAKNQHPAGAVLTGGVWRSSYSLSSPTGPPGAVVLLSIPGTAAGRAGAAWCRDAQLSAARGRSLPALPFAYLGPCEARAEAQFDPPSFLEVRTAPPRLSNLPGSTLRVVSGRKEPAWLSWRPRVPRAGLPCHRGGRVGGFGNPRPAPCRVWGARLEPWRVAVGCQG